MVSLNNSSSLHLRTIISDAFLKLCSSFRSDAHCATWPGSEIQDQHQGPFPRIWPVFSKSRDRHHQRDAASLQVGSADRLSFDRLTRWSINSGYLQGDIRMLLFHRPSDPLLNALRSQRNLVVSGSYWCGSRLFLFALLAPVDAIEYFLLVWSEQSLRVSFLFPLYLFLSNGLIATALISLTLVDPRWSRIFTGLTYTFTVS